MNVYNLHDNLGRWETGTAESLEVHGAAIMGQTTQTQPGGRQGLTPKFVF